jgi:flagellar FliJ protein
MLADEAWVARPTPCIALGTAFAMRRARSAVFKRGFSCVDAGSEMQRFTFRLEGVRRLRMQQEQTVQVELARVMRERNLVVQRIEESRAAEQELYEYLRAPGRTAAEMAHVARFGTWHRQQIFNLGVKLRQFDKGVELVRARLQEARARREALDRLHEHEHEAWVTQLRREEQAELDEIATMRAARGLGATA